MLTSVEYRNYKCLSGLNVRFGALTILTGANSAGKSSVIQSLILAKLASEARTDIIELNGPYGLNLGDGTSLIPQESALASGQSDFIFCIGGKTKPLSLSIADSDRFARVKTPRKELPQLGQPNLGGFTYLAAERDGPREWHELPSISPDLVSVGHRGENAAAILAAFDLLAVQNRLHHRKAPKLRFAKQVEAWMEDLFPGIQLRVQPYPEIAKAVLSFKYDSESDEWVRPSNVGFGLSACLPIITAALLAKPQSLMIIDSPESHLHPAAQSKLGRFLALVALSGVQIVIETHSDHVLNGIRLATVLDNASPGREQVVINHFRRHVEDRLVEISISEKGELSQHPSEFFDQSAKDLSEIVRRRFKSTKAE